MKNRGLSKSKFMLLIPVIATLVITSVYIYNCNKPRQISCDYNESFPNIDMYTVSGMKKSLYDIDGEYKVIFYLSDSCEECITRLENIKNIMKVFDSPRFSYIIVWDSAIPLKKLEKAGLSQDMNYSVRGKVSLYEYTPAGFILDKTFRLVRKTFFFSELIEEIWTLDGSRRLNGQVTKLMHQEDPFEGEPCYTCK